MEKNVKNIIEKELNDVTLTELKQMYTHAVEYKILKTPLVTWVINILAERIHEKEKI